MFCFNLRSFSEHFRVHESVMCPLTLIMKLTFDGFCKHSLMIPIHCDVNSQDTKFGSKIFNSLAVIPINIFRYQNKSWSKRVLNKTDVQDLPGYFFTPFRLLETCFQNKFLFYLLSSCAKQKSTFAKQEHTL